MLQFEPAEVLGSGLKEVVAYLLGSLDFYQTELAEVDGVVGIKAGFASRQCWRFEMPLKRVN